MKKICFILSVMVAMVTYAACDEETSVSGVAPYSCEYEMISMSSTGLDTLTVKLQNAILLDMQSLRAKHDHSWDYQFEGSSVDAALKAQDKIALSYYDDAVSDLIDLKTQVDALVNDFEWGKGSFSYTYKYKVSRLGETLAESDEVTFSYSPKK